MGEPVEYAIKTISDIIQLDKRQRHDFMKDLWAWLNYQDQIANMLPEFEAMGVKISPEEGMIWCDDGDNGVLSGIQINGVRVDFKGSTH